MQIKGKVLIVDDEFQFGYFLKAVLFFPLIGLSFVAPDYHQFQAEDHPFNSFVTLYKKVTAFVQLLKSSLP